MSAALFSGMADLDAQVNLPLSLVGVSAGMTGTYVFQRQCTQLAGGTLSAIKLGLWGGILDGVFFGAFGA